MNALATIDPKPLSPVSLDEARQPLAMLFAAYPEPFSDRNAEKADALNSLKINAYLLGLDGIPGWTIEQAVKDFIQGKVDRQAKRKGMLPTVEELAAVARALLSTETTRQATEYRRQNPPRQPEYVRRPFMDRLEATKAKYAAWERLHSDVSYDQFWTMRRARQIPIDATWVPALNGAVMLPPASLP